MASANAARHHASSPTVVAAVGHVFDALSSSPSSVWTFSAVDPGSARTQASSAETMPVTDSFDREKVRSITALSTAMPEQDGPDHHATSWQGRQAAYIAGLGLTVSIDSETEDVIVAEIAHKGVTYLDGRIREGDRIMYVNDCQCRGVGLSRVSNLLEEIPGTAVVLHVAPSFQGADSHVCTFPVDLVPGRVRSQTDALAPNTHAEALPTMQPYTRRGVSSPVRQPHALSAGIGLLISRDESSGSIYVKEIASGGPADRSRDVQAGDKIISVDGKKVEGMRSAEVMSLIRGDKGSAIDIKLERKAPPPSKARYKFHVEMMRDDIAEKPAESGPRHLSESSSPSQVSIQQHANFVSYCDSFGQGKASHGTSNPRTYSSYIDTSLRPPPAGGDHSRESTAADGAVPSSNRITLPLAEIGPSICHPHPIQSGEVEQHSAGWFSSNGYAEFGSPEQAAHVQPRSLPDEDVEGSEEAHMHAACSPRELTATRHAPAEAAASAASSAEDAEPERRHSSALSAQGSHGGDLSPGTLAASSAGRVPPLTDDAEAWGDGAGPEPAVGGQGASNRGRGGAGGEESERRDKVLTRRGSHNSYQSWGRKESLYSFEGRWSRSPSPDRGRSLLYGSSLLSDTSSVGHSFESFAPPEAWAPSDPFDASSHPRHPQHAALPPSQSPPPESYSAWIARPTGSAPTSLVAAPAYRALQPPPTVAQRGPARLPRSHSLPFSLSGAERRGGLTLQAESARAHAAQAHVQREASAPPATPEEEEEEEGGGGGGGPALLPDVFPRRGDAEEAHGPAEREHKGWSSGREEGLGGEGELVAGEAGAGREWATCGEVMHCSDCMYDIFFTDVALEPSLNLFISPTAPTIRIQF